jgi:hypothetical protein
MLLPLVYLWEFRPRPKLARAAVVGIVVLSIVIQVLGVAIHSISFLSTGINEATSYWKLSDSPLVGQAWLVAYHLVSLVDRAGGTYMIAHYPWRSATGVTPAQIAGIHNWNYWWWQIFAAHGIGTLPRITAVLTLLAVMGVAVLRLGKVLAVRCPSVS